MGPFPDSQVLSFEQAKKAYQWACGYVGLNNQKCSFGSDQGHKIVITRELDEDTIVQEQIDLRSATMENILRSLRILKGWDEVDTFGGAAKSYASDMGFDMSKFEVSARRGTDGIEYVITYRNSAVLAGTTGPFGKLGNIIAAAREGVRRMMEYISKSSDEFEASKWVAEKVELQPLNLKDTSAFKVIQSEIIRRLARDLRVPEELFTLGGSAGSASRNFDQSAERIAERVEKLDEETAKKVLDILKKKDKTEKDKTDLSNALGKRKLDLG